MLKNIYLLTAIILIVTKPLSAQTANFVWAKQAGGASSDVGYATTSDASGNVYTTGQFQGTVDFDPGSGVFNLSTVSSACAFVLKLDATGNFVWAKQFNTTVGASFGKGIAVDAAGNVFTTGFFMGNVDFDPGAAIFNLNSSNTSITDVFVSKLDAGGNFVWATQIGSPSNNDEAYGIALDASGNVYTTGILFKSNSSFEAAFVSKLNSSGSLVWTQNVVSSSIGDTKSANSVAVDALGNVYTTGYFNGTCNFGSSSITSLTGSDDIFISKLTASGNFVWAKAIGSTGGNSNTEVGNAIVTDAGNNVYVAGAFNGTADFDPGAGTYTLVPGSSFGNPDAFTLKLDVNGNFIWAKQITNTISNDFGYAIALDVTGNVYTAGRYAGTCDFDPGVGTYILNGSGGYVTKLDAAGNFIMAYTMQGDAYCFGISVNAFGSIHTTGLFNGTTDFDPSAAIYNLASNGFSDIFIHKMCQAPTLTLSALPSASVCLGNSLTLTASGATSYTWSGPGSPTNAVAFTPTASANYSLQATASNGCVSSNTLDVVVYSLPVISVNSGSICSSLAFTILPSGAASYTIQGGNSVVNPTTSTTYTVIGTSAQGCLSSNTATANVMVVNCTPGAALNFDGVDDWVEVAHHPNFNITNSITIEAWIKTTQSIEHYITTKNEGAWYFAVNGGTVAPGKLTLYLSGTSPAGWTFGTTTVSDGNWHHVAATYDGAFINLYVDGQLDGQFAKTGAISTVTDNVAIGKRTSFGNVSIFNGSMDEFRIWNSARTQCEINRYKNCEIPTNATGLIANYHFNQGFNLENNILINTLTDATTNIHTGTLTNMALTGAGSNWVAPGGVITSSTTPLPGIGATATNTSICLGGSTTLNGIGATSTYTWSNSVTNAVAFTPTATTIYTVSGSNTITTCSGSATIAVTVNPLPTVTAVSNTSLLCVGQTASLTASGANTYTWTTSSTNTAIAISPTVTTNYTVTGTNANGCQNMAVITQSVSACTVINNSSFNTQNSTLVIYPNPSNGVFNLETTTATEITIVDVLGKVILKTKLESGIYQLNLSEQANGVYFLKANANQQQKNIRLIKN